ncbi:MAG: class I SAM-dependent methyltransferase [Bryobacteraceae bacterium]
MTATQTGSATFDLCPACDSTEARTLFHSTDRLYHTTGKDFAVVECRQCGLIRLFPPPLPEELGRYYPEDYWFAAGETAAARLEETYRRFVLRDHVGFVRRALLASGESGVVLDVGCGGGLFLKMLKESGVSVAGLDFSREAAGIAWRSNGVPAVCGSLAKAPFARKSCAIVTMFHVLEHLYDPASYLETARELLQANGRLVIQVPNASCWQFLLFGERWNGVDVPRHLTNFRKRDIERLLDHCGFEVLRWKHFSLRDNPAGLATTLVPALDPMARRVRHVAETSVQKLGKDLAYVGLVVASLPFTLLEAACRAGSTIMVEARKRS